LSFFREGWLQIVNVAKFVTIFLRLAIQRYLFEAASSGIKLN